MYQNMTNRLAISVVLLCAAVPAMSAEWLPYGISDRGTAYVDKSTITRTGSIVKLWSKTEFAQPIPYMGKVATNKVTRFVFNCQDRTYQEGSWTAYSNNGDVVLSILSDPSMLMFREIPPETGAEILYKHFCAV